MNPASPFGICAWALVLSAAHLGCSAGALNGTGGAPSADIGGSLAAVGGSSLAAGGSDASGGSASPTNEPLPLPTASAGAPSDDLEGSGGTPPQHPLFGSGEETAADLSDPCQTTTIWKEETAIELERGSLVLFEGTLWELTGTCNENWALPDCTPPGIGWCKDQYAWQQVGLCPDAGE